MTQRPFSWRGWLLAALIGAMTLTMVGLGFWQLDRMRQRQAQNDHITTRLSAAPIDLNEAPASNLPEYQPVRLRGTYDFSQEIVLRNRARQGSPGVHVLTPLRLAGSEQAVLVDRGWIPYDQAEPADRAEYQWPAGEITIEGIVRPPQTRESAFLPADPTLSPDLPRVDAWFRVDLAQIQDQVPYPLRPYYVEAGPGADPQRLPLAGYEVDLSPGPHLGYAIQWFAFAAILAVGSLVVARQRWRKSTQPTPPPPPSDPGP
jgi:surfeit locus 1 family protein